MSATSVVEKWVAAALADTHRRFGG